jgi:hypothetical protein
LDEEHPMTLELHEDEAVGKVTARLTSAYRDRYPPTAVESIVVTAHRHFSRAPIRDFIPVLVERRARETLDHRRPSAA